MIKENYLSNSVLVGGSALALHLKHRKSEDLKFFTYKNNTFNIKKIKEIVNKLNGNIVNISDE